MNNFEHNRESWNELTALHADSTFYDIDSFKKGKTSLNHIEIEELGDIEGKRILHHRRKLCRTLYSSYHSLHR